MVLIKLSRRIYKKNNLSSHIEVNEFKKIPTHAKKSKSYGIILFI